MAFTVNGQVKINVQVKGVSLSHVVGEATKGRQSPRPLESALAAGAAPALRVPSSVPFTDGPLVTGRPCPDTTFHRRPGGSSWFTSLPQRSLIAASTSKPRSKSKE